MTDVKRTGCLGIVSVSRKHYHYYFDFDAFTLDQLLYSAMYIAQEAKCDLLIRKSSDSNYHVICPNPMTDKEVVSLQRLTPRDNGDIYLHLDEVRSAGGLLGTGNTLRLRGKYAIVPTNQKILWVGERPVCQAYADLFDLTIPEGRKIIKDCSPTFSYYSAKPRVAKSGMVEC